MSGDLWRVVPFRYQFAAQATSMAGSTLSPVALSLGLLQLTGSPRTLSLVLAAQAVPTVVFLLVGGVWADRLPRHKVMVCANLVTAVTQGCLGIMLLTGAFHLWLAMGLQFIAGTALAFYFPSTLGLTALTVPAHLLQRANAMLSLTRSTAGGVGPLVAGLLVVSAGAGWALVADGVTFLASAALLARLKLPKQIRATQDDVQASFLTDLRDGFREVTRRAWVWSSITAFMFTHLASAIFMVLGPVLLLRRDHGVFGWAAVIAGLSVGQVVGDFAALRLTVQRPLVVARVVELLSVPALVGLAFGAPIWLLVIAAVCGGIALTLPDALWLTTMQGHLPKDSLSRVSSYDWLGSLALRPLGYVSAAALAAVIGTTTTFIVAATLIVLTRIGGLCLPDVRALTNRAPKEAVG
ncbi:MFS transporter [Kribbella antibiotica]|uniref:MFS transporter n=1 Tax=Kribbella antibiotica TaxID=190195 RepID=A0A4R4ZU76_9ACTN|nr:MFS transporter [Kribbella antibiotica]TDD61519.1 MFS transporter [Kribbella antibiotica]